MKNGQNQWEDRLLSWMGRVSSLKMPVPVLAKVVCTLTVTSVKIYMNKSMGDVKVDCLEGKLSSWAMELVERSG